MDDSYIDFDLSHQLYSSGLVVVGNMVGMIDGGSLVVVDREGKTCGD